MGVIALPDRPKDGRRMGLREDRVPQRKGWVRSRTSAGAGTRRTDALQEGQLGSFRKAAWRAWGQSQLSLQGSFHGNTVSMRS